MKKLFLALLPMLPLPEVLEDACSTYEPVVSARAAKLAAAMPATRVPVVVELFTSEGCSSCPAADQALREMAAAQAIPGVEIVALGQHVDYWNRLGWTDRFSSPQFSARQQGYAERFREGNYTPQAVVHGRYQLVGSQRQTLVRAITQAAQAPRATVNITRAPGGNLRVQVQNLPAGAQAATVELALTETGLSSQVGRGENEGRLLHHAPLVRTWRTLGTVGADGTFTATAPLKLHSDWKAGNLRAVVLVQEKGSRQILGVGSLPLS